MPSHKIPLAYDRLTAELTWGEIADTQAKGNGRRDKRVAVSASRPMAYKWIRIIWKCWQTREKYDEARYVQVLRNKGSKLVAEVVSAEA